MEDWAAAILREANERLEEIRMRTIMKIIKVAGCHGPAYFAMTTSFVHYWSAR